MHGLPQVSATSCKRPFSCVCAGTVSTACVYRQIVRASAVAAGALFILRSVGDGANELAGKSRDPVDCMACTLYVRVLGMSEYWTWMIDTEVVSRIFEPG
jgi:hypothetical protein